MILPDAFLSLGCDIILYMEKMIIMIGLAIGSTVGGMVPLLWGDSAFSMTSLLLSGVGGVIGIWVGYRIVSG